MKKLLTLISAKVSWWAWFLLVSSLVHIEVVAAPPGLDSRPVNTTCLAFDRPNTNVTIDVERVFPSLPLSSLPGPDNAVVSLTLPPNDSSYWYFTTRGGYIGRFENILENTTTVSAWEEVLDFRSQTSVTYDGGLIQMVFHPNFPTDPRVFVNYTVPGTLSEPYDIIVSSIETTDGGQTLDPSTETILIRQPRGTFHQGGFYHNRSITSSSSSSGFR